MPEPAQKAGVGCLWGGLHRIVPADSHNMWDEHIWDHQEPEYSKSFEEPLLPQYAVFVTEYNVSISGGLYSASQNTKQNNQASTP